MGGARGHCQLDEQQDQDQQLVSCEQKRDRQKQLAEAVEAPLCSRKMLLLSREERRHALGAQVAQKRSEQLQF